MGVRLKISIVTTLFWDSARTFCSVNYEKSGSGGVGGVGEVIPVHFGAHQQAARQQKWTSGPENFGPENFKIMLFGPRNY